jgi:hypothetical protein
MKKDINFIRYIKPQIIRKEKEDKSMKGESKINRELKILGIEQKPIDIFELFSIFKFFKR